MADQLFQDIGEIIKFHKLAVLTNKGDYRPRVVGVNAQLRAFSLYLDDILARQIGTYGFAGRTWITLPHRAARAINVSTVSADAGVIGQPAACNARALQTLQVLKA